MKDQIEGSIDETVGAAKSNLGEKVGDDKLAAEGVVQQAEGAIKKAAGDIKDRLSDAVDFVKDAAKPH